MTLLNENNKAKDDGYNFDLGTYQRDSSSSNHNETCQKWLNRGLVWLFAYNHEEALHCFAQALQAEPHCILANAALAYAVGPNYNLPWADLDASEKQAILRQALHHLHKAKEDSQDATPVERAWVQALCLRYPEDWETNDETFQRIMTESSFDDWHKAYADAMYHQVYKQFPNDLDVVCWTVEAMMVRTPWQLWDLPTGKPAEGADTARAQAILEQTFATMPNAWKHPGLLHMYIHLMEMSPWPEKALPHGDALTQLVPGAGHLIHMATHIDVLTGDYQNVVSRNLAAVQADNRYVQTIGLDNPRANGFYTIYRMHNYHFAVYGAMFLGQRTVALDTAQALTEAMPTAVLQEMADWFEAFIPVKQHVLVRFGMWQEILQQELPKDTELYSFTTAMMRYARTIALANLKRIPEAQAERELFLVARDAVPASRMVINNTCKDVLKIAYSMMMGELEYHKDNFQSAFDHLRTAVRMTDEMPYDEPWGWMQPVRHALGALLLEQGRYAEAEEVYRQDLGLVPALPRPCQHPRNVWSLHGLYECLQRRNHTVESQHVKQLLDLAQARAERPIQASCYCRQAKATDCCGGNADATSKNNSLCSSRADEKTGSQKKYTSPSSCCANIDQ